MSTKRTLELISTRIDQTNQERIWTCDAGDIEINRPLILPWWADNHEEIMNLVSILNAEVSEVERIKDKFEGLAEVVVTPTTRLCRGREMSTSMRM